MITSLLLRQVPANVVAGVEAGDLKVYGSIIRAVSTGRIVGHLQETSRFAEIAGRSLAGFPGMDLAVDLAGHGASIVQNEQIKAAVGIVQKLQLGAIAVSAASIGVSAAGFTVMAAKLARIDRRMDVLDARLSEIAERVEHLKRERVEEDLVRLRTASQLLEEGWTLRDGRSQWRRVADEALLICNQFARRSRQLLELTTDPSAAEPCLEAAALAASLRTEAWLAAGEDDAARASAREGAVSIIEAGDRVNVAQTALTAVMASGRAPGSNDWVLALDGFAKPLAESMTRIRAREEGLVGTVATLSELERRGIGGREWLDEARSEREAPLLFLPTEGAE